MALQILFVSLLIFCRVLGVECWHVWNPRFVDMKWVWLVQLVNWIPLALYFWGESHLHTPVSWHTISSGISETEDTLPTRPLWQMHPPVNWRSDFPRSRLHAATWRKDDARSIVIWLVVSNSSFLQVFHVCLSLWVRWWIFCHCCWGWIFWDLHSFCETKVKANTSEYGPC